jgi:predicted transposase YbfD/YdcC
LGNLRSIGIVEVRGELPDKVVTATRFYLTSLPADTALFAQALREHWHIENRPHWILDALFREDESRMRKTQGRQNFAVLRPIAPNLFQRPTTSEGGTGYKPQTRGVVSSQG